MFPEGRLFEFLIVGAVALIVVGPKDLPVLLRKLGQFMAKVRSMAAEFRASFDEMARQSELDELRKEVEAMRQGQLTDIATHAPEVNQAFNEISQGLSDVGVDLNTATSSPYVMAQTEDLVILPPKTNRARHAAAKKPGPRAVSAPAAPEKAKAPPQSAPKTPARVQATKASASKSPASKSPPAKSPAAKSPAAKASKTKAPTKAKPAAAVPAKPRARKVSAS
jgi:sec-independent protein translocase protein TatB